MGENEIPQGSHIRLVGAFAGVGSGLLQRQYFFETVFDSTFPTEQV